MSEELEKKVAKMGGGDLPIGKSMGDIHRDNLRTAEAIRKDQETQRKMDADFVGHRGLRDGRHFLWNTFRYHDSDLYRVGVDRTFPNAPGSESRMDGEFCPKCDLRHWACKCEEEEEKGKVVNE